MARYRWPPTDGPEGGSIVGLDFDASVAWPAYDWMGVSKAALESVSATWRATSAPRSPRQPGLRRPDRHRRRPAASPASSELAAASGQSRRRSAGTPATPTPVADAAVFLLSDLARGISGEIVHVDGGFHAVGAEAPREGTGNASRAEQTTASL